MSPFKVLLKITGSIAAYKSADLISKLVQKGHAVKVVATPSALNFIGEATLEGLSGEPVLTDTFVRGGMMSHIHLMRWADAVLVCPASANFLNKASAGISDDLVGTLFLAHDFDKPYLIAPAMNTSMYRHPTTQASLEKLNAMGLTILETGEGSLACGETGMGRMLEPHQIIEALERAMSEGGRARSPELITSVNPTSLPQKKKLLITAGGTREAIDSVRDIRNTSTGKTGAELADLLAHFGYEITFVHAQDSHLPKSVSHRISFRSFSDLDETLQGLLSKNSYDGVIHLAAVSDFSVSHIEDHLGRSLPENIKIDSKSDIKVVLKPNHKIINRLRSYAGNDELQVVGFKLTTGAAPSQRLLAAAKIFEEARVNAVVHNDLTEIDTDSNQHPFHIFLPGMTEALDCSNVEELVERLNELLWPAPHGILTQQGELL